ncbi:hypothetical protein VF14_04955 [Nostoc linckia z18]|nr:hypothetical protein VF03_16735 [Nostoc linckia z2]PHK21633.1 hypothetical protein VF11_08050 [Nostoc linckia z14]PHK36728.1 hypothetical protein VF14_04955 [Nostoc linckia z18]PHK47075.1 hypothetical protein VF13_07460 [Nostoc linckia z16]
MPFAPHPILTINIHDDLLRSTKKYISISILVGFWGKGERKNLYPLPFNPFGVRQSLMGETPKTALAHLFPKPNSELKMHKASSIDLYLVFRAKLLLLD